MRFVSHGREIYVSQSSPFIRKRDNCFCTIAMKCHQYPVVNHNEKDNTLKLIDHSLFLNMNNRKNSISHSNLVYEQRFRQSIEDTYDAASLKSNSSSKVFCKHVFVPISNIPKPHTVITFKAIKGTHWTRLDIEDLRKDDHNGEVIVSGWKYGGHDDVRIEFDSCYWRELNWFVTLEYNSDVVPLAPRSLSTTYIPAYISSS